MVMDEFDVSFLKNVKGDMLDRSDEEENADLLEECERKLLIYKTIVNRYADVIASNERKTITELKQMVDKEDSVVLEIVEGIKKRIGNEEGFIPERDVERAVEEIVNIGREIRLVKFPVTFWLSFKEINELKIADGVDRAVFMCAIARALGYQCEVCVSKDGSVYLILSPGQDLDSGEVFVILPDCSIRKGLKKDVINEYCLAYGFNDVVYEEFNGVL